MITYICAFVYIHICISYNLILFLFDVISNLGSLSVLFTFISFCQIFLYVLHVAVT